MSQNTYNSKEFNNELKPLLNRDFILITLSSFAFFFTYHSFILLPVRIEELGGDESTIGFIMGAATMATVITTPMAGISVDRFGRKWFLVSGGLLMAIATLPFAYFHTLNLLFPVLRVLHGAALSLCFISAGTLIADVSSPLKRSQAMGVFGICSIINVAVAPFVGKVIVDMYSFSNFFVFDFAFGLLAFVVALFIKEPERRIESDTQGRGFFKVLFGRGVLVSAFTLMVAGSGFITVFTFVPVFARRIGVEAFEFFFITYTIAVLVVRIFGGWIPDKYGRKRAGVPALLLFALGVFGLSLASGGSTLIMSGILLGIGHGVFYPAIYALVIDISPEIDRGKAISICSVAFTLGGTLGVFAYGVAAELWGFNAMFGFAGIVCLVGFLAFIFWGGRSVPESR